VIFKKDSIYDKSEIREGGMPMIKHSVVSMLTSLTRENLEEGRGK